MVKLNIKNVKHLNLENERYILSIFQTIEKELTTQETLTNNFVGWRTWPRNYNTQEFSEMETIAKNIRQEVKASGKKTYLVVIGIGGSYLGTRAGKEFIQGMHNDDLIEILYMGNTMSSNYINQCLAKLKNADFYINVISKSGTTLEPALSFRLTLELLIEKYGNDAINKRIFATTDAKSGVLVDLAKKYKLTKFVIPSNIGGRYSVLTPVGIFPLLVAGINIKEVMAGAYQAMNDLATPSLDNPAYLYAYARNMLAKQGKTIEVFASFEMQMFYYNEFLKQLFGESEGKDYVSLWPAACIYSTDLHSLGQPMQEGKDTLFETFIKVAKANKPLVIDESKDNYDQLNYVAGKDMHYINYCAYQGTLAAHANTKSIIEIEIEKLDAYNFGYLTQFFFNACAVSALLLGVNPFNQNGVEIYKKNMFSLLKKK